MGPMLLLVLGILSAVGFSLYQFGEHHRFDIVPDAKGGIFILDKKSAAINYCNDKKRIIITLFIFFNNDTSTKRIK